MYIQFLKDVALAIRVVLVKQKASPDRFTFKRRPRVRISMRIVPRGTPTMSDGQSENASQVLTRCTPYFKRSKRTVAHNRCRHFYCNKLSGYNIKIQWSQLP